MPTNETIESSCLWLSGVSCYDFVKDFSGPIAAVIVAIFTVTYAFKQLAIQHENSLNAQKEESKRNTRIELFKEIGSLLEQSSTIIREVNIYCMTKKYSNIERKAEISIQDFMILSQKFGQAVLQIISKVEHHEIVNQALFRVFRYSLQSVLYDFNSLQLEQDRFAVLESTIEVTNNAQMYIGDFQVCMQNFAYGEIFNSTVPHRDPPDKRHKVITNDPTKLDDLLKYFMEETEWGKTMEKYEKEAKEKYAS